MSSEIHDDLASEPKFRRRAEKRPDEVLDAARALFLQSGYANTSVDAIARKAGISKGAVYLYFPTKQSILEGLVDRAVKPISAQAIVEAASHHGNVRATVSHLLGSVAERLSDPKVLAIPKIIIREAVAAPDIAAMYRRAVLDQALPAVAALIREGVRSGEMRPVDPELTVRSIVGPVIAHILLAEIFGIRPERGLLLRELVENHLGILFDGLDAAKEAENG